MTTSFEDEPDRNLIPIVAKILREQIDSLVRKFGGEPDAALFGADL